MCQWKGGTKQNSTLLENTGIPYASRRQYYSHWLWKMADPVMMPLLLMAQRIVHSGSLSYVDTFDGLIHWGSQLERYKSTNPYSFKLMCLLERTYCWLERLNKSCRLVMWLLASHWNNGSWCHLHRTTKYLWSATSIYALKKHLNVWYNIVYALKWVHIHLT